MDQTRLLSSSTVNVLYVVPSSSVIDLYVNTSFFVFATCYTQPSCSTILLGFRHSTSVVFMLIHFFTTTPSLHSHIKVHLINFINHGLFIHFIYHRPSYCFYLSQSISFIFTIFGHANVILILSTFLYDFTGFC